MSGFFTIKCIFTGKKSDRDFFNVCIWLTLKYSYHLEIRQAYYKTISYKIINVFFVCRKILHLLSLAKINITKTHASCCYLRSVAYWPMYCKSFVVINYRRMNKPVNLDFHSCKLWRKMNVNMKKTTLAAAVVATLSVLAAGQASASVYAGSALDIQGLLITTEVNGVTQNASAGNFTFTNTNTATLDGASDVLQTATCFGLPPVLGGNTCADGSGGFRLNALAANAPGGSVTRVDNVFNHFGPGAEQYSNSDSVIWTAELAGDPTTATSQIAESELQMGDSASASAEIQSSTSITWTFDVLDTMDLSIAFEADPFLLAAINQAPAVDFLFGTTAADLNMSFTLSKDNDDDALSWSPNGVVSGASGCSFDDDDLDGFLGLAGVSCNETADGETLNTNTGTGTDGTSQAHSVAAGFNSYALDVAGLSTGKYSLVLNSVSSTSMSQVVAVPEPGMLALLGAGLLGMGAVRRRKNAA